MPAAAVIAVAGGVAAIVGLVIGRFAAVIGASLGLLDFPDDAGGRKQHARVTPLVGGLAAAVASLVAILATLVLMPEPPAVARHLGWLGVAIGAMFLIGVTDDRFLLSVRARLGLAVIVLILVITAAPDFSLSFIRFPFYRHVWLLGPASEAFTLLCLVGLLNAINMADGKNGIVISLGLIWAIVLLLRLPVAMLPVMASVAVALAILLWFNMRNRLFLGDGGGYALSAVFGLLAIYAYNHDFAVIGADDIVLMFAIPVFDTVRLLIARTMQRRSPFDGGRDHLHHYLYASVGWPRGLWVYVALVGLPNAAAVAIPGTASIWLVASAIAYTFILRKAIWHGRVVA